MNRPRLTVGFIIAHTAKAYGIDPKAIFSARRARAIARPRQVAIWLAAKSIPNYSAAQIGRVFRRDHATVAHAIKKIDEIRSHNADFAEMVDQMRTSIIDATEPPPPDIAEAERLAMSLVQAFETAAFTLARSNPVQAIEVFTPIIRTVLARPSEGASP